ncbi:unnamed protein product [Periconia digitata]|uniref:Uncharacterized protein n=1 Tax=Periconia digitata TaxID=1303443 RepID=A0A9W4UKJ4_9PLEO|nr:unnamed protein product [Periconia digitata]
MINTVAQGPASRANFNSSVVVLAAADSRASGASLLPAVWGVQSSES